MALTSGSSPHDPAGRVPPPAAGPFRPTAPSAAGDSQWGVRPALPALALLAAAGAGCWAGLTSSAQDRVVALVVVAVAVVCAVTGLRWRRRLVADHAGLTIRSLTSTRTVPWSHVLRMTAPTRRARGLSSVGMELELVDDELLVLRRLELGADPEQVRAELQRIRPTG